MPGFVPVFRFTEIGSQRATGTRKANNAKPMLASQHNGILLPYSWMYSISRVCNPLFRRQSLYADKADFAERIKRKHANNEVGRFPGLALPMGPDTANLLRCKKSEEALRGFIIVQRCACSRNQAIPLKMRCWSCDFDHNVFPCLASFVVSQPVNITFPLQWDRWKLTSLPLRA